MKRDAGWATALVAVVTAVGVTSLHSKASGDGSPGGGAASAAGVAAQVAAKPYKGPCHELKLLLGHVLGLEPAKVAAPKSCDAVETSKTAEKIPPAPGEPKSTDLPHVQFVVATLPDPVHTHLSLVFDRDAEAIQQAAQDSKYTYDSSWLPWETDEGGHPLVADQDIAEDRTERRENQPGVLLFRGSLDRNSAPYKHLLVVFVVGEDATDGIHREQFENAWDWITTLKKGTVINDSVQVLGPSFSGSLSSLAQLLQSDRIRRAIPEQLEIYSGHVSSRSGATKFEELIHSGLLKNLGINFLSFQQDDETLLRRYYQYLIEIKVGTCRLAVVAEDETAYGFSERIGHDPAAQPCSDSEVTNWKPPTFFYPRDISALRDAYQEQSLFSGGGPQGAAERVPHTLRSDLADPEGEQHDTIRSYGGSQTALSEEAVLLQIVSMLRAHHSQFVMLRSSNPLDRLFLAHFFKVTYPEGRVIIIGNDLLLRRDLGPGGLNGIMTLSEYPLLPEIDDWTVEKDEKNMHSHRAFTQDGAQGVYTALRFLLNPSPLQSEVQAGEMACPQELSRVTDAFLPKRGWSQRFPDYANPFWMGDRTCRPVTWLSVLGSDGFWPVAALYEVPASDPISAFGKIFHSVKQTSLEVAGPAQPDSRRWPAVPLSMNVALVAVMLWAGFHTLCCCYPSVTVKPDHRSYFARMRRIIVSGGVTGRRTALHPRSHMILVVISSALVVIVTTVLAWGYGWMSGQGAPIQSPRFYALCPEMIWIAGFMAVAGNALVEDRLNGSAAAYPSFLSVIRPLGWQGKRLLAILKPVWKPTLTFGLITVSFYCFFLLYLDSRLPPEVKTLTYFRSMNLTTGVSPIVPLVLLALGMYGWCWYGLRGLALFGADRPLLPLESTLLMHVNGQKEQFFSMLAAERAAWPIEDLCWPLNRSVWGIAGGILLGIYGCAAMMARGVPLRSIGTQRYSLVVCVWIAINCSVLLANAWQLMRLWLRLRSLLVFLDKLPLRRTLQAMVGFSWHSIWKLGGDVVDIRYKLFYRQFESLTHLQNSFADPDLSGSLANVPPQYAAAWAARIEATRGVRRKFAAWYSDNWDHWTARDLRSLQEVQQVTAELAAEILLYLLVPSWGEEKESLLIVTPQPGDNGENEGMQMLHLVSKLEAHVKHAEECVCLLYLGFIQNILGRMRSMVMGMMCLFLSIAFVVPSYPFDPRPLLTGAVVFLFVVVGIVVFQVYSQMFRDATLSHLTNTKPGELGGEFWMKLIGIGVGPVLGLVATVVPGVSEFLFSWLQPSLSTIK